MVTHCLCRNVSFADLLRLAAAENLAIDQLKERTGCCTGCTMCEPYVRLALATGRTQLPVLDDAACQRIMTNSDSK